MLMKGLLTAVMGLRPLVSLSELETNDFPAV